MFSKAFLLTCSIFSTLLFLHENGGDTSGIRSNARSHQLLLRRTPTLSSQEQAEYDAHRVEIKEYLEQMKDLSIRIATKQAYRDSVKEGMINNIYPRFYGDISMKENWKKVQAELARLPGDKEEIIKDAIENGRALLRRYVKVATEALANGARYDFGHAERDPECIEYRDLITKPFESLEGMKKSDDYNGKVSVARIKEVAEAMKLALAKEVLAQQDVDTWKIERRSLAIKIDSILANVGKNVKEYFIHTLISEAEYRRFDVYKNDFKELPDTKYPTLDPSAVHRAKYGPP